MASPLASDPADVGGAPEDAGVRLEVEHGAVSVRHVAEVAARGVQDALGFPVMPKVYKMNSGCSASNAWDVWWDD
jgi:hypothetical protein